MSKIVKKKDVVKVENNNVHRLSNAVLKVMHIKGVTVCELIYFK